MRARSRSRSFYTERGPGARLKPPTEILMVPHSEDEPTPATTTTAGALTSATSPVPSPSHRPAICEHGGEYRNGRLLCLRCLRERVTNPDDLVGEEWEAFGDVLWNSAAKIARINRPFSNRPMDINDCMVAAVFEILFGREGKNRRALWSADKPDHLAYTIMARAIQKINKEKTRVVSGGGIVGDVLYEKIGAVLEGTRDRSIFKKRIYVIDNEFDTSGPVRIFPGVNLLWTAENHRRLKSLLTEALSKLPKRPFDHSLLVDMRVGFTPDMQVRTWPEIAQILDTTENKARGAYARSLEQLKEYIRSHLASTWRAASAA